jgi:hypothetical protein
VLRIVSVTPSPGWIVERAEQDDQTSIEIRLESGSGEVRFEASLVRGVIVVSFRADDDHDTSSTAVTTPGTGSTSSTVDGNSGPGGGDDDNSGPGGGGDDDSSGSGSSGSGSDSSGSGSGSSGSGSGSGSSGSGSG